MKKHSVSDDTVKADLTLMYDRQADDYGEHYRTESGNYFKWRKLSTALALAGFVPGGHLLEVGCANGHYSLELAKLGFRVTGADLSKACVIEARRRADVAHIKNVEFIVADAEQMISLPPGTFDGAVSFSCFRYLPNPQKGITELYRVVKSGGTIAVDFPNVMSPWFRYLKPWLRGPQHIHIHDHHYSTWTARRFLVDAGFLDIVIQRILFTPNFIGPGLLRIMKLVDKVGELPPFDWFAAILMCKGRKP